MNAALTYDQLLSLPEWQTKRQLILIRDENQCQKCQNHSYKRNDFYGPYCQYSNNSGFINFKSFNEEILPVNSRAEKSTILIKNNEYVMLFCLKHRASGISDKAMDGYFVAAARYLTADEINYYFPFVSLLDKAKKEKVKEIAAEVVKGIFNQEQIKENRELSRDLENNFSWIFAKDLNVHHTYYRIDKQPWEYPDEALQTLCRSCHEQVHREEKIPVLNSLGNKIGYYKPCYRCNGAGWFPEYSHVEGGICFACRGKKYLADEFIIKN